MRAYRIIFVTAIILFCAALAQAQNNNYIQFNQGVGDLLMHSPRLTENPERVLLYSELSYAHWGHGNEYWHQHHNFPHFGLALRYNTFGLDKIYGKAYSLFPYMAWKIGKSDKSFFNFRLGAGIGYANRPYHRELNPLNKGLSTKWNNITDFNFSYNYMVNKDWKLQVGLDFSHLSNASTRKPNTGLNQYFAHLGLAKSLGNQKNTTTGQDTTLNFHRWGVSYSFNRARREPYESNGPKFTVLHQTLEFSYRVSPVGAFTLGLDYEWHEFEEYFKISTQPGIDPKDLRSDNDRLAIVAGYEIGMGKVAIQIMAGAYFNPEKSVFIRFPVYNRLKCKYYFIDPVVNQWSVYGVICLKSHIATAEYFSLGIGASVFTN